MHQTLPKFSKKNKLKKIDVENCPAGRDVILEFIKSDSSTSDSKLNVFIKQIYEMPATYLARIEDTTIGLGNPINFNL